MRVPKIPALILVSLLGLSLVACSSASKRIEELNETPVAASSASGRPADSIRVLDSGFTWDRDTLSYSFTAENASKDTSMEDTHVQVNIYDETGEAIGSDAGTIDFILPGQVVAFAGHVPMTRKPERVAFAFTVENEASIESVRTFERIDGRFEPTSFGGRVVAPVKNPYDKELRRLKVVAVLRKADGKIINGGSTTLEMLPPQGESVVTIDVLGAMQEPPAAVDVYIMFSAETVFRLE